VNPALWISIGLVAWLAWAWVAHRLVDNPRGDVETGVLWPLTCWYARRVHHLRVFGRVHVPTGREPGPLVVVANHTAGVDPILVQAACPFFVRWMMADDMQIGRLGWFWRWVGVIGVNRGGRQVSAAREAVRHLESGGVLGIFPEGTLERPARHVLPFLPGVGLIVYRSGARVLPVVIDGTPRVDPAWSSLWHPSRATMRFLPTVEYADSGLRPAEIAADLRRRFVEATGWPMLDTPAPSDRRDGK
jgi:1-acyl-sn-glycerol-3-phosphate acyltransferase